MCPPSDTRKLTDVQVPLVQPPGSEFPTPRNPLNNDLNLIPDDHISQKAYKHAYKLLPETILHHSIRVYLYADALARELNSTYIANPTKHSLLFTACLFHDIGATDTYDGPQRFEVAGADAAVAFLSKFDNVSERDRHDVWTAIACHTSPQIAERIGELSRLVRIAVITDFGRKSEAWDVLEPLRAKMEKEYGRAAIEKVLGDAVVEQAKKKPGKAPMVSWPGVLLRAHLEEPEWDGVNKAF